MQSSCLARSQASALQPRACVRAAPTAQLSGLQALSHALSKLCGRRACAPLSATSEDEPGRSEEGNNAVAPPWLAEPCMQCVFVPWSHASLVLPCNVAAPPWAVKLINTVDAVHTEQRHQGEVLPQQGEVQRQQGEVQQQQGEVLRQQGELLNKVQGHMFNLVGVVTETHVRQSVAAARGHNYAQPHRLRSASSIAIALHGLVDATHATCKMSREALKDKVLDLATRVSISSTGKLCRGVGD